MYVYHILHPPLLGLRTLFFIELHRQVNNFKQPLPEKDAGGGSLCIFEVSLHRVRPFTLAS